MTLTSVTKAIVACSYSNRCNLHASTIPKMMYRQVTEGPAEDLSSEVQSLADWRTVTDFLFVHSG